MNRDMFELYKLPLSKSGGSAAERPEFKLGADGKYTLRYIPFEHVNKRARIVIVGITPGPNQVELAYESAKEMIKAGYPDEKTLVEIKKHGAFGSSTMRPNLVKMLRHFGFDEILGIPDVNSLWGSNAHLLHATSVVPHAAFTVKRVKGELKESPFAGSFKDVMGCGLFKECFEDCFLPSLKEIDKNAVYIGLGRCPEEALEYAVAEGYLSRNQVLGSFSHPSTSGGSSVSYYLREKSLEDLSSGDPVRRRTAWLDAAYLTMKTNTERLRTNM